ncbi:type I restriction endonuclease subunit R [Tautonia plasticadhaerens]|uniref:Type I restriction enzyme endonuclease subunit n=1 Tax=Tautonia plasticadhaerens TaxID=2527974 RepID=A0A518GYU0_9BACT|nr:type I restriction endonuclease subunit R [Tautonia plasticadhaerens]QDV33712.1 Type-1 restriction enzyme R protein [Tautonia plasticadhaerens]
MSPGISETVVEDAALSWFAGLGYMVLQGTALRTGEPGGERATYADVVLEGRLRSALAKLNPGIPAPTIDEAARKVLRTETPSLVENNRRFHRMLTEGVDVEYRRPDGSIAGDKVWLVDFDHPDRNDWLAVNQFTVVENRRNRRADVVILVNGLPLAVVELKNPGDENATVRGAFNQLQTYKHDIPGLFSCNEVLVASDGLEARVGSLTADWERFMPWRTVEGDDVAPKGTPELEVLLKGVFDKGRFLDLLRNFIVFEDDGASVVKKLAGYHQFHAVNKAVACTVGAASPEGDKRVGVIWHTQGSGKSLTMAFYAGKIVKHPAMANPTLVVLTDRNDLDDQLYGTFSICQALLRQSPVQVERRDQVTEMLKVASGGVVFTTIQKFLPETKGAKYPLVSDRRNIVVIADEAHRSQYDFIDGFARHMRDALPNASFIGFTGTPIEATDKNTQAVFGDYIDVYDITRSVEDGATVRIYYEGRLARIALDEDERPNLDEEFEEVTEGQEVEKKEKLKSKWARLEAMVGAEKRVKLIARDIVAHFEQRTAALEGKGMIVGMSRRICVDLYDEIIRLRPEWHSDDDAQGTIKVVMTGSAADPQEWQPHIRTKARREAIAKRFKDPANPLRLVIVRDMWLTGFDAPCLHTMYADKPMQGHGLMQAIARVNRVFRDKPGGLIVDYLGLAHFLKKALAAYTEGDRKQAGIPKEEAVALLLEKHEVVSAMLHGFDFSALHSDDPGLRLGLVSGAMNFILERDQGAPEDNLKSRFMDEVSKMVRTFALAVPHEDAQAIRDEVGFFQAVRAGLVKYTPAEGKSEDEIDSAIRQLVSKAIATDRVIDIFADAGMKRPEISILSDEFLAEVRDLPQRNLALELLRKLINDEIKARSRKNLIEARSFTEMLEQAIQRYQNRSIETAQVIAQLIELAKEMRAAHRRGEALGMTEDELAFYDALEVNDSAVKVLGDKTLRTIARELVEAVRRNVSIDWTEKESVKAKLRTIIKRLLRKHGYPPDKQEQATLTVLAQAEALCKDWAA